MKKFSELELDARLMIWLTAGIVGVAVVTAFILIRQANVMQGQLDEMKGAGEQTDRLIILNAGQMGNAAKIAKSAQIQADAAQANVKAIQRQMRQDQRAWIGVELTSDPTPNAKQGTATVSVTENQPIGIPLRFTNTGKTAARHVEAIFFVEVVKNGQVPLLNSKKKAESGFSAGIVYPSIHSDIAAFRIRPATRTEQQDLISGQAYIAVYGRVDYRDVFKVPHWNKFCLWIPFASIGYTSRECAQYNNVDDN